MHVFVLYANFLQYQIILTTALRVHPAVTRLTYIKYALRHFRYHDSLPRLLPPLLPTATTTTTTTTTTVAVTGGKCMRTCGSTKRTIRELQFGLACVCKNTSLVLLSNLCFRLCSPTGYSNSCFSQQQLDTPSVYFKCVLRRTLRTLNAPGATSSGQVLPRAAEQW